MCYNWVSTRTHPPPPNLTPKMCQFVVQNLNCPFESPLLFQPYWPVPILSATAVRVLKTGLSISCLIEPFKKKQYMYLTLCSSVYFNLSLLLYFLYPHFHNAGRIYFICIFFFLDPPLTRTPQMKTASAIWYALLTLPLSYFPFSFTLSFFLLFLFPPLPFFFFTAFYLPIPFSFIFSTLSS